MILPGVELKVCPTFGWMGGPNFETLIKRLRNGHERRRALWGTTKHSYSLPFQNISSQEYLTGLKSLFLSALGQTHSFLVKDYTDFTAESEAVGVGNGIDTSFPLVKNYTFGSSGYTRRILFPISPDVFVNGLPVTSEYDPDTNEVVLDSAPAGGSVITWSGEFRVLVRFNSDAFPMSIETKGPNGSFISGSVDLVEVWE